MREGAATGILPSAGLSAAQRFAGHDHGWEQSWSRSRTSPGLTCSRRLPSVKKGRCGRNTTPRGPKQVSILMLPAQRHTSSRQRQPATPHHPLCSPAPWSSHQTPEQGTTEQSNERQSRICNTEMDGSNASATHSSSQGGTGLTTPHCHLPNLGQSWLMKRRQRQAAVLTPCALPESPQSPQERCLPCASVPHNHHTVPL